MKCTALIRDNATGLVRPFSTEEPEDLSTFNWQENNFSCDCNRGIFFSRAGAEQEDNDAPCGQGRYSVNLRREDTGETYYREFP